MRNLILLRAPAGAGKSTWIAENGLQPYTISADDVRMMFQSPTLNVRGELEITNKNDSKVWNWMFGLLQERMARGEFTIVDATHARAGMINKYKDLCQHYRYRAYTVQFDIPTDDVLRRNAARPVHKRVPEDAILTMVSKIETQPTPTWTKQITPEEFWSLFHELNTFDFNKWNRIHHLGDIHGCVDPLVDYFDAFGFNSDEFYIFTGDYFDRGIQNVETFRFLQQFVGKPNVLFLEGNHERWLWYWANNEEAKSKEFEHVTKPQFINAGVDKSEMREFYRRLGQMAYYEYRGKVVFVCHGGLPVLPSPFTATDEMIKGVGKYEDVDVVEESFMRNTPDNFYQVHGHRNIASSPVQNGRCFNICEKVEFGGMFRAVILDNDGFSPVEIKNNTFAQRGSDEVIEVNTQSVDIIEAMRQSKYIYEKDLGNNISSFNFTREAFLKGKWDDITTKARGLFVNVATKEVVARSYEKFFNLGERDETKVENLRRTMQFPAVAYMKINGYLGIVGYNSEDDSLFVATKSTNQGEYQKWFYDILSSTEHFDQLKDFLKENNVSMVFEVVDPVNDPHIIKYNHPHVVLLDVVYRTFEFQKYAYPDLIAVANYFRFYCKPVVDVFNNWAEFYAFVESAENDYEFGRINGSRFEGVVVERADGFQFKIKFLYYKTWKMLRGLKDVVARRRQVHTEWLNTPTQNRFYAWVKSIADLDFVKNTDIITLRDMYLSDGGSE